MSFGKNIASIRRDRKISQEDLAKKIGIHANVLGRYEREEARPSIEMAAQLADALEVSLDFLAGKTDVQLDNGIVNKVLTIQKLPDEDQKCIMYAIDGLIRDAKTRAAYS